MSIDPKDMALELQRRQPEIEALIREVARDQRAASELLALSGEAIAEGDAGRSEELADLAMKMIDVNSVKLVVIEEWNAAVEELRRIAGGERGTVH
jgi:hypothetical protein